MVDRMRAAALQILGAVCIVIAAALYNVTLGVLIAGLALLIFGIAEEL